MQWRTTTSRSGSFAQTTRPFSDLHDEQQRDGELKSLHDITAVKINEGRTMLLELKTLDWAAFELKNDSSQILSEYWLIHATSFWGSKYARITSVTTWLTTRALKMYLQVIWNRFSTRRRLKICVWRWQKSGMTSIIESMRRIPGWL